MFSLKLNSLVTVSFIGLSIFVVMTNCCSSQLTKSIEWSDYVSCNDHHHNDNIMIETIEATASSSSSTTTTATTTNNDNNNILTRASGINSEIINVNKNFTINFLSNNNHNDKNNDHNLVDLRNIEDKTISSKTYGTQCSQYFDALFCLNGGRCLNYIIGDTSVISCECAEGYYGERCDFKYTIYDKVDASPKITSSSSLTPSLATIASKCTSDFDLLFCLNGGKCFNYAIGDTHVISCLCAEGYYGERCDFKYIFDDSLPSISTSTHNHHHHHHQHHQQQHQHQHPNKHIIINDHHNNNGHVIRKAKVYLTPFIIGLLITIILYVIFCATFLNNSTQDGQNNRKFYYHRSKHKIFGFHKIKYFIFYLNRK